MASSSDRWRRLEALFYEALELKPDARVEFLDKHCEGDTKLRKEIETLLASAEKPMDFLHESVREAANQMMTEDRHQTCAPGTRLAHYNIISLLGTGGMGEVYLAEDYATSTQSRTQCCSLRNLLKMSVACVVLSRRRTPPPPSIIPTPSIHEFGQANGMHFIASEFIDGATLRKKIIGGRLELNAAIDIAMQMASALAAAHASGIVHRDIKPENVIVRTDGIVKVLDFGIAKLSEKRFGQTIRRSGMTVTSSISEPGMVMGTARYMSPEQARGVDVDARSDIFSLGSVMYELVTGRSAFEGQTSSDVIAEILKVEPPPPAELAPDVPPEIEHIIGKALRKDRDNRYQNVKDLLIDLQDYSKEAEFQAKLQKNARPERARIGWTSRTPARAISARSPAAHQSVVTSWWIAPVAALVVALFVIGYFLEKRWNGAPTSARPRSLAVLPFRNLKQDPQTDFLGFSLADEIITKLGYVNALTIRPSSSVNKYRDQIIDPIGLRRI